MVRTGDFATGVVDSLRDIYQNRCAICLNRQTRESECAQIFDSSKEGERQVYNASSIGVIESNFDRGDASNGIVMCPTCHHGYFTPNCIALCPAIQVLDYLIQTLQIPPESGAPPSVLEIFQQLHAIGPDPSGTASTIINSVSPFLHFFILVPLKAFELGGLALVTRSFPPLYICRNNSVSLAQGPDLFSAETFRLFDVHSTHPPAYGRIPLDANDPEYPQQRYWHLPNTRPEVILGALMMRVANKFGNRDLAITKVRQIIALLDQRATSLETGLQAPLVAGDHTSEGVDTMQHQLTRDDSSAEGSEDTTLPSPESSWRFGPQSTHANIYFASGNRLTGAEYYRPPFEYLSARLDEEKDSLGIDVFPESSYLCQKGNSLAESLH